MLDLQAISSIYNFVLNIIESSFGVFFIIVVGINFISFFILVWQYKRKHNIKNKWVKRFLNNGFINYLARQLFETVKVEIIYCIEDLSYREDKNLEKENKSNKQTLKLHSFTMILIHKIQEIFTSKIYFRFKLPF